MSLRLAPIETLRAALLCAAACTTACATPSRRLPAQVVDDPVTLPAQLLEVQLRSGDFADHRRPGEDPLVPSFRYGLTDRVTMHDLTMFEVALMDDAPPAGTTAPPAGAAAATPAATAPFSLALRAGTEGFGWSTSEGFIVSPVVGVLAHKRIGPRLRLGGSTSGGTWWSAGGDLRRGFRGWWLGGDAGLLFQVLERVALDLGAFAGWGLDGWDAPAGYTPDSHWYGARPGVSYRPFHWLMAGLGLEVRFHRLQPIPLEPTPDGPLPGAIDWSPPPTVRGLAYVQFAW